MRTYTTEQSHLIAKAIELMAIAHAGQLDKGGDAYIHHPLHLGHKCKPYGVAYEIAAYLHDSVEDSPLTLDKIGVIFGTVIQDAVDALTRRDNETYEEFVERCSKNAIARRVKLEDLKHNMNLLRMPLQRDIGESDLERWNKYRISYIKLCRVEGIGLTDRALEMRNS